MSGGMVPERRRSGAVELSSEADVEQAGVQEARGAASSPDAAPGAIADRGTRLASNNEERVERRLEREDEPPRRRSRTGWGVKGLLVLLLPIVAALAASWYVHR